MNLLNGAEMVSAQNAAYGLLVDIGEAETLLRCAWDRFFGSADKKGLNASDALELGTLLLVCCDRIADGLLHYRLEVGQGGGDVDSFFETVADFQEARELNELNADAGAREKELSGAARDSFMARRLEALQLPAPLGIKALRGLLKGGEAGC